LNAPIFWKFSHLKNNLNLGVGVRLLSTSSESKVGGGFSDKNTLGSRELAMISKDRDVITGVRWMYGRILACAAAMALGAKGGHVVGSAIAGERRTVLQKQVPQIPVHRSRRKKE
jgi:hypothetical protein